MYGELFLFILLFILLQLYKCSNTFLTQHFILPSIKNRIDNNELRTFCLLCIFPLLQWDLTTTRNNGNRIAYSKHVVVDIDHRTRSLNTIIPKMKLATLRGSSSRFLEYDKEANIT